MIGLHAPQTAVLKIVEEATPRETSTDKNGPQIHPRPELSSSRNIFSVLHERRSTNGIAVAWREALNKTTGSIVQSLRSIWGRPSYFQKRLWRALVARFQWASRGGSLPGRTLYER